MKMLLITYFLLFWFITQVNAQRANAKLPLTNNVPIVDYGMHLALCDNVEEAQNDHNVLNETELKADKDLTLIFHNATSNRWNSVIFLGMTNSFDFRLFNQDGLEIPKTRKGNLKSLFEANDLHAEAQISWILHNTSSNRVSVIYIGITNSFDFQLFNSNGVEIAKTAKGKAMSVGPASLNDLYENKYLRRLGGQPNGVIVMDFPKLTELFNFLGDGVYILEVRYWTWFSSKKRFILSEPVRLRVIKDETRTVPRKGVAH